MDSKILKLKKFNKLPLRNGVGIVLLNNENKVFVGKRIDYPNNFWHNKLVVDVLSVKNYPKDILGKYIDINKSDILLTHPMFGPDSASISLNNKNFVYWKENINNQKIFKMKILYLFLILKLDPLLGLRLRGRM